MIQYVAVDKTAQPKRGKFIFSSVETSEVKTLYQIIFINISLTLIKFNWSNLNFKKIHKLQQLIPNKNIGTVVQYKTKLN